MLMFKEMILFGEIANIGLTINNVLIKIQCIIVRFTNSSKGE